MPNVSRPRRAGNPDVCRDIAHRRAKFGSIGDSLTASQSNSFAALPTVWKPDRWAGFGAAAATGSWGTIITESKQDIASVMTTAQRDWTNTELPAGFDSWSMWYSTVVTCTGSIVPSPGTPYANEIYYMTPATGAAWSDNGAWLNSAQTITATILAHANGLQSFKLHGRDGAGVTEYEVASGLTSKASTTAWINQTVTLASRNYNTAGLIAAVQATSGNTPANTDSLLLGAFTVNNGSQGLQLSNFSIGGWWTTNYLNTNVGARTPYSDILITDANWKGILQGVGVNIMSIWLGQNGMGVQTKAQYKSDIQSILTRGRLAHENMRGLLTATHDTDSAGLLTQVPYQQHSDALYEISQSDAGCYFIDFYAFAGTNASMISAGYLTNGDPIHFTASGGIYAETIRWREVALAGKGGSVNCGTNRPPAGSVVDTSNVFTDGLLDLLAVNEGTGAPKNLWSPANNPTLKGSPTWSTHAGVQALYCTGGTGVTIPSHGQINAGDFAVFMEIYLRSIPSAFSALFSKNNAGTRELVFCLNTNGIPNYMEIGAHTTFTGNTGNLAVPVGQRTKVLVQRRSNVVTFWVDGVKSSMSVTDSTTTVVAGSSFGVAYADSAGGNDPDLDLIQFSPYTRSFSDAEATALFASPYQTTQFTPKWAGASSGDVTTSANWTGAIVPDANSTATFDSTTWSNPPTTIGGSGSVTWGSVNIANGGGGNFSFLAGATINGLTIASNVSALKVNSVSRVAVITANGITTDLTGVSLDQNLSDFIVSSGGQITGLSDSNANRRALNRLRRLRRF